MDRQLVKHGRGVRPDQHKFLTCWPQIKAEWLAGEKARTLARKYGIDESVIRRRRQAEQWGIEIPVVERADKTIGLDEIQEAFHAIWTSAAAVQAHMDKWQIQYRRDLNTGKNHRSAGRRDWWLAGYYARHMKETYTNDRSDDDLRRLRQADIAAEAARQQSAERVDPDPGPCLLPDLQLPPRGGNAFGSY